MNAEAIISTIQAEDKSYWQRHVTAYNRGGVSKIRYCRENSVHYHRFLYWHAKLSTSPEEGALIPVKLKSDLPSQTVCALELNQECRILIYDEALALKLLASVVK